jgi:hypothetical protein
MKNKFSITWKKISGAVFGFFGIGFLTACYGVDEGRETEGKTVYGQIYGENGELLDGIKVCTKDAPEITTFSKNGYYELCLPDSVKSCTVYFEDVDGEKNGEYNSDKRTIDFSTTRVYNESVSLKKK